MIHKPVAALTEISGGRNKSDAPPACDRPPVVATATGTDYWVTDVGYATSDGLEYEWATVVAGQPRTSVYHDEEVSLCLFL